MVITMRIIVNFLKGTIISVWLVISIFTTICLISYNDYLVSEIGEYSIFVVDSKDLEPDFKKNDIVIVEKHPESSYKVGDKAFFYYGNKNTLSYINYGEITEIQVNDDYEDKYTFTNTPISYGNLIGPANGSRVIHKLGLVLRVFESRWGFMFLVILPTLFAIVYEVYYIAIEVKKESNSKKEKEEN